MTNEDRKAFEEWAQTHSSFVLDRRGDGYFHGHVDAYWRAWQAATAEEFAAEKLAHRSKAFKAIEDYWKTAYNESVNHTLEAKRAQEFAEKALAQHAALSFVLKQALGEERKSVWRDVLLTVGPEEALSTALEEEREACAKVADEHAAKSVLLSETAAEDTALLHGAEAKAAIIIAAAIRARKGGSDVT